MEVCKLILKGKCMNKNIFDFTDNKEFIDTQIISYKYKNNTEYYNQSIEGKMISSIVALEFLGIMKPNENKAKFYPIITSIKHTFLSSLLVYDKAHVDMLGKSSTDRLIIDFNGEFDSIIVYSNEAISYILNHKSIDVLLSFAKLSLNKEEFKSFRKRVNYLIDNNLTVVPVNKDIVIRMKSIYEHIKKEYNVKEKNYRNSFMDLLILATALEHGMELLTCDKELNKALKKSCDFLRIDYYSDEIMRIGYKDDKEKNKHKNDNKGYINNSWRIIMKKGATL